MLSPVASRTSPGVQAVKVIKNDTIIEARILNEEEQYKPDANSKIPKTMKKPENVNIIM